MENISFIIEPIANSIVWNGISVERGIKLKETGRNEKKQEETEKKQKEPETVQTQSRDS